MKKPELRFARLIVLCLLLTLWPGCTLLQVELGPRPEDLEEKKMTGQGRDKVLVVDVNGFMSLNRGLWSTPWTANRSRPAALAEQLDKARRDDRIKALIVRIDSPGGAAAAADVIHHQIEAYKRETGVKVVAQLMGVAASGGYYAALAADRIVALPASITGSVGVISLKFDLSGLMDKVGFQAEAVKTGRFKDIWSPFRPADQEEERLMQALVDDLFKRFKMAVRQGRPGMSEDQLKEVFTGRVFTAGQALDLGLIDRIGYPEDAFELAQKLAGLEDARLVSYQRPGGHQPNLYARNEASANVLNPADLLPLTGQMHLMYLWLPGLK